jgi:hypothetical protein
VSTGEVFQSLGGGLTGLLGVIVFILAPLLMHQMNERIKDRDKQLERAYDQLKDRDKLIEKQNADIRAQDLRIEALIQSTNHQTDLMQSWMPRQQYETVREKHLG